MSKIFDFGNSSLNELMKDQIAIKENDHILEIGFGTGKLINHLLGSVNEAYIEGIDFSKEMVSFARKRNKNHIAQKKVSLKLGHFEQVDFKEEYFDTICSANTIYFWQNPDSWIKKIIRLLKPGGKLILAFEDKDQLEQRSLDNNIFCIYSLEEIKTLLKNNGFSKDIKIVTKKIKSQKFHCAVAVK